MWQGAACSSTLTPPPLPQALLEEIERHGEKVEECRRFAKQYINAIKVRPPRCRLQNSNLGPSQACSAPEKACETAWATRL